MSYDMISGDEDIIRQHVSFKYTAMKQKNSLIENKLKDVKPMSILLFILVKINELVRMKNP